MCLAISSLYAVLVGLTNAVSRSSTGLVDPTTVSPSQVIAAGAAALAALGAFVLVNVLVLPVTLGALSLVGSAAVYGDAVDTRHVIRRALDRGLEVVAIFVLTALVLIVGPIVVGIAALIAVAIANVVGFAVLIFGFFLFLVPVLYVVVRLSLAIPVVMREQRGPLESLRRSWQLVAGGWWWVFGVAVVIGLLIALVNAGVTYRSFIGRDTPTDFVIGFVVSAIAAAASTILYGVASGVVYAMRAPEDTAVEPAAIAQATPVQPEPMRPQEPPGAVPPPQPPPPGPAAPADPAMPHEPGRPPEDPASSSDPPRPSPQ
jgi:hypothetical protein